MARQARAIQTRRQILEAAGVVFDQLGYESATITEILSRAGVTKGALYFHFDSKESLARGVLAEAVTTEGVLPQESKLQECVDLGLVLAHRVPREPMLSAAIRLSADQKARTLFGTSWTAWANLMGEYLDLAKAQGELLPNTVPQETAMIIVAAWTGVEIVTSDLKDGECLERRISRLYDHLLPSIAVPGVLAKLDTSPDRGARIWEAHQKQAAGAGGTLDLPAYV
ncbi:MULTISPECIES: ScbR family autoregulator-binding transcription factor [unclassified Streptomyces]|uniref:ScbR family autoregulator-binding transcription factor n=1 Tax=unclassified Streptomyces TaxID=2593676 RepID=UPI000477F52B|nr:MULTISPECIES: ScbR family autoregulator-binding transcription factor [unclassified Streptomyces]MYT27413.1 TetR family transcriptional regulator [Streptomyces sp. SID8354]